MIVRQRATVLFAVCVGMTAPALITTQTAAETLSTEDQLADIRQQFEAGDLSPREYMEKDAALLDSAVESDEDLALPENFEPSDAGKERHRREALAAIGAKKQAECDQLTVICADEWPAELARASDYLSITNAIESYTDGSFSPGFSYYLDAAHPVTLGQLYSRQFRQNGVNMAGGAVIGGGLFAGSWLWGSAPATALATGLEVGGPVATAASATELASTAATPVLVTEAPAAAAAGGALLARLAGLPTTRYVVAAGLGSTVGIEGLGGTGGILGSLSAGHSPYLLAGGCAIAVLARGCIRPNLFSDPASTRPAQPVTAPPGAGLPPAGGRDELAIRLKQYHQRVRGDGLVPDTYDQVLSWTNRYLTLRGGVKVTGAKNIPASGPIIVIASHRAYDDIPVIAKALSLGGRRGYYVAKAELFDPRPGARFSWLSPLISPQTDQRIAVYVGDTLNQIGGIPVQRGTRDSDTIKSSLAVIRRSEPLVIFPEGTRYKGDGPSTLPFKDGAAKLALQTGAPVLPVGIQGTRRWWGLPRVKVCIGAPICLDPASTDAATATAQFRLILGELSGMPAAQLPAQPR